MSITRKKALLRVGKDVSMWPRSTIFSTSRLKEKKTNFFSSSTQPKLSTPLTTTGLPMFWSKPVSPFGSVTLLKDPFHQLKWPPFLGGNLLSGSLSKEASSKAAHSLLSSLLLPTTPSSFLSPNLKTCARSRSPMTWPFCQIRSPQFPPPSP